MTAMIHPSVRLLCVLIGLFVTVHSQRLKPASDSFEILTGVMIPCGSRCTVQSYRQLVEATNKCILSNTGIATEVNQYLNDNNLNGNFGSQTTYQQIYDAIFREGRSPLCRWYRKYGKCETEEYGRICGNGIENALTRLLQNFDKLICSQNPNYLACVAHPSLSGFVSSSQASNSPYGLCVTNLANIFANINEDNYYQELILKNNGRTLFSAFRTYGNCIGNAVKTVSAPPTGCTLAGDDVKKSMMEGINYFDFGQQGKDYVKCFANNDLHTKMVSCVTPFANDLDTALPGGLSNVLAELNATLFRGQPLVIAGAYNAFSSCLKQATREACPTDTDSRAIVDRILLPLDIFFDGNSGNDNIQFCDSGTSPTPAPTPSPPGNGTKTTTGSLELLVSGLLMLLSVILKQH